MSVVEIARPEQRHAPADHDPLCHLAATCCPPYEQTLCGRGIDGPPARGAVEVSCVVCIDMIHAILRDGTPCSRCGSVLR